ncbi:hypothetical protein BIW11_03713 [Tropilaelaps mercedesae]|uniref:Ig-like domain-containing protein n=1 Tax=Tropilaelaps mercedesae TaxID=418985 RepID=A0A1V9XGX6_9ACAR|nr:hypothetical protein BIW11_03713 [Tropilaelaps mercedesae]
MIRDSDSGPKRIVVKRSRGAAGVTVTEVRLQTESATQDQFVLEGEPASLVCFFQLKPNEEIQRVTWLKDGTDEVYVWRRKFQPLARLLFQDRTDLSNSRRLCFIKVYKQFLPRVQTSAAYTWAFSTAQPMAAANSARSSFFKQRAIK